MKQPVASPYIIGNANYGLAVINSVNSVGEQKIKMISLI